MSASALIARIEREIDRRIVHVQMHLGMRAVELEVAF